MIKTYMIYMLLQITVQIEQQTLREQQEQLYMKDLTQAKKQKDMH